jgi:hypothetical protein
MITDADITALDTADPLAAFRDAFSLPGGSSISAAIPWVRRHAMPAKD